MSLSAVQGLGLSEVGKVLMVGEDLNWERGAVEVVSPGFEGVDDGKEFTIIDAIILFCLEEQLREVGTGMPVSIGVGLEEDSTGCMFGGIGGNGEGCREVREMENWF